MPPSSHTLDRREKQPRRQVGLDRFCGVQPVSVRSRGRHGVSHRPCDVSKGFAFFNRSVASHRRPLFPVSRKETMSANVVFPMTGAPQVLRQA